VSVSEFASIHVLDASVLLVDNWTIPAVPKGCPGELKWLWKCGLIHT